MGKSKKKKSVGLVSDTGDSKLKNLKPSQCLDSSDVDTKVDNGESLASYSVNDLLERVSEYTENLEYDLAARFCQRALEIEPNNCRALECMGVILMEGGHIEPAILCFKKAVKHEPDNGHLKYSYLGQLSEGHDAVVYYEKAVSLMQSSVDTSDKETIDLLNRQISTTFCALAEIYMTDLCMESDAEEQCGKFSKLAFESDQKNLEAVVTMVNFLLSKGDMEDAKNYCLLGHNLWKELTEQLGDSVPEKLSYQARIDLVKLLIEVELYEYVSSVVEQLIEEDEDDILLWYYMGLAKSLEKGEDSPRYFLEKALEIYVKTGCDNDEMRMHIEELLESCPDQDECSDDEGDSDSNGIMETE